MTNQLGLFSEAARTQRVADARRSHTTDQPKRPHLAKLNRRGQLSLQYMLMQSLALSGFVTSAHLRRLGEASWRGQSAGQRLRDVRRVFGLHLIGPIDGEDNIRREARRHLSEVERRVLYPQVLGKPGENGRVWILSAESRSRARWLVETARLTSR